MQNETTHAADGELSQAEAERLVHYFRAEAESDPRYRALSDGARHVLLERVQMMNRQAEIWLSQGKTLSKIAALSGGRRSQSGYISKPTLNKYDAELERAGLMTSEMSKGKIVRPTAGGRIRWDEETSTWRTPSIRVWKLDREIWMKAWARLNAWKESMLRLFRRTFYTAKAKTYVRREEGRSRSFHGGWKVPVEDRDNDSRARDVARWRDRGFRVPPGSESIYPYEDEEGSVMYLVVRMPGKRFLHVLPEALREWEGDRQRVVVPPDAGVDIKCYTCSSQGSLTSR
jgi:hypothetical protein